MPQRLPVRRALLVAVPLSLAHFASFEIRRSPIVWDMRFYLYFASRVAHGAVPYRDFFENKTPLSIFAGAVFHRIGLATGLQPVHAIRAGFLLLAAAAGLALFAVHRRLANGRFVPGFLALCAYLGFPLMGLLPAIGVCPKTLTALFASATALAVGERRFVLAGACGALAFLDWQIGALAAIGAVVGALAKPEKRLRSAARVVAGGLLVATPFVAYFLSTGALGDALRQTVWTLLARTVESAHKTWAQKGGHLLDTIRVGCHGHEWLFVVGLTGMLVYPLWLWRRRRHETLGMALALAVYHYGLAAFSLFDFQSYGDLYILLYSVAFFAAVVFVEAHAQARICFGPRRARMVDVAAVLLLLVAARPSVLAPALDLAPPTVDSGATLADQKQVYREVLLATAGRRVAFVGPAELAFLGEQASAAPFVYWNSVTNNYYRRLGEGYVQAMDRILRESGAELLVGDRTLPKEAGDRIIASESGAYSVTLRSTR